MSILEKIALIILTIVIIPFFALESIVKSIHSGMLTIRDIINDDLKIK